MGRGTQKHIMIMLRLCYHNEIKILQKSKKVFVGSKAPAKALASYLRSAQLERSESDLKTNLLRN